MGVAQAAKPSAAGGLGRGRRILLPAAILFAVFAGGAAFLRFAKSEKARTVETWRVRLSATADDRKAAIENHLAESHSDARGLEGSPVLQSLFTRQASLHGGIPSSEKEKAERSLEGFLGHFSEVHGYEGVALLDGAGRTLLATPGAPPLPDACRRWAADPDFRTMRSRFFVRSGGGVLLAHAYRLSAYARPSEPPPLLLLLEDPARWLYPLLAREPSPTATGEVILVRREGEMVQFLSPLRFSSKPFLEVTWPFDAPAFAAREALAGRETFGEYRDYGGEPVFAAMRRIAGTRWGLVAKVSRREALAPWKARTAWMGGSGVLLYLLIAGGLWVYARRQRLRYLESLEAAERFSAAILDVLPGVVYCYDEKFRFRHWNGEFERVTGYSGGEIEAMKPLDFFPEEEKSLVAERIGGVFRTGSGSVEAHFLTKDGRRIPYFFTGVRVLLDGKPHLVGVGIDTSERERALAALRESEARGPQPGAGGEGPGADGGAAGRPQAHGPIGGGGDGRPRPPPGEGGAAAPRPGGGRGGHLGVEAGEGPGLARPALPAAGRGG